jgi:hypothetical protein
MIALRLFEAASINELTALLTVPDPIESLRAGLSGHLLPRRLVGCQLMSMVTVVIPATKHGGQWERDSRDGTYCV